jgi:hypothetical protein
MVFQALYDLVEAQFSAKIKKPKTHNGGKYINKVLTGFIETMCIINTLSVLFAYESNGRPEYMSGMIVTIVQLMTVDCANRISQALWAEPCSTAVHIENRHHIGL